MQDDRNKTDTDTDTSINLTMKRCWPGWRTKPYSVMPHVSDEGKALAENFEPHPSDVIVLSFPKTGTTWTQTVCEQLRTQGAGYDHFTDIDQVQPWIDFCYDVGQEEELGSPRPDDPFPRIFKSHQLPSAVNQGCKILAIVRDPEAVIQSWFHFQKAKRRENYKDFDNVNDWLKQGKGKQLFASNCIFGTNIWEMYQELWEIRNEPGVMILCYEALLADKDNQYANFLPAMAEFLNVKVPNTPQEQELLFQKIATLVSRDVMLQHVDKFEDAFIAKKGQEMGRAKRIMEPAAKVNASIQQQRQSQKRVDLNLESTTWLWQQWEDCINTGHASYDAYAADLSTLFDNNYHVEKETAGVESEGEPSTMRATSTARRRSTITLEEMPQVRSRRESLTPQDDY